MGRGDKACYRPAKSLVYLVRRASHVTEDNIAAIKRGECIASTPDPFFDEPNQLENPTVPKTKSKDEQIEDLWRVIDVLTQKISDLELKTTQRYLQIGIGPTGIVSSGQTGPTGAQGL